MAFSSSKLPNRAPPGHALLRLFFRPSDEELASISDAQWAARAEAELGRVLLLGRPATQRWVSRWPHALPVFDDAHRDRIASLERALEGSSIWLAGSAFHGAGIDAAIRSAERLAHAL